MKTKRPEKGLNELELDAISTSRAAALEELNGLLEIKDEDLTDEQLTDITELTSFIGELDGETTDRERAAEERSAKIAAAREAAAAAAPAAEEPTGDPEEDPEDPQEDPAEPVEKEKETVTASGAPKRSIVRTAAPKAPVVTIDKPEPVVDEGPQTSLVASAGVPDVAQGHKFGSMLEVAEAFSSAFQALPSHRQPNTVMRSGVAKVNLAPKSEFSLENAKDYDSVEDLFRAAADEKRLSGGSLVAAGGWCAPSETLYDIPELETVSGIFDLPEVNVARGGISFTQGPDFATDIYDHADFGFTQTETQAEAGLEKPILQVECIDFEEVRLDAFGYGISAGILTNKAYPELIRRYLRGGAVAHAHRMNSITIARTVAGLTAFNAATAFGLGSVTADSLSALEFIAVRTRYRYRIGENATLEGVAPIWYRSVIRQDLAYRDGLETIAVTDAQIDSWLAARKIKLQWVYDWQSLTATSLDYPDTVQVGMWPAGTFVKGVSDVISLDAIYDSVNIKTNNFLAIFFEEAMFVAKMQASGNLVTIPTNNHHGRTGAGDITNKIAA